MERKDFRQKNNDSKSTRGFGDSNKPRSEKSGFKKSSPSRSSSDRFSDKGEKPFGPKRSFGERSARPDRSDKPNRFDRPLREDRPRTRTGNTSFRNFEDLDVFKKAYNLSLEIHNFFVNNNSNNTDDTIVMLKSSSKNVCTCIAGFANKGDENSIEHAISLCDTIKVWLKYALDLEYIDFKNWDGWRNSYVEVAKMLIGLANSKG